MALTQVTPDVVHNVQSNITQVGILSNLTVSGNVSTGNLSATNLTGLLQTASQPNITSVGTLANLTVSGNVVAGNLNLNSGLSTARMGMITSSGTGNFTYNTSLGYSWFESGNDSTSPAMRLQFGSLGIGTFDPGYRLHVVKSDGSLSTAFQSMSNTAASIRFVNQSVFNMFVGTESSTGGFIFANTAPFSAVIGHHGAHPVSLCTNLQERVRVDAFGNVGINTTNPTERLHVLGNARVTGTIFGNVSGNVSGTANNSSFLGGLAAASYANIAAFTNSLTTSGWQRLPGGLIIQWFSTSENSTQGSFTVNYPITFPNAFLAASCSTTNTTNSSNSDLYIQFVSSTTANITLYRQAVNNFAAIGAMVIALGY